LAVAFLSDEFMEQGAALLNSAENVLSAVDGVEIGVQFLVTEGPDGDFSYYIKVADGRVEVGRGELEGADATMRSTYTTTARLARRELSNQKAFLTGKVKFSGNLAAVMRHGTTLDLIQQTLGEMDVDY
jgi:hypothetical protein